MMRHGGLAYFARNGELRRMHFSDDRSSALLPPIEPDTGLGPEGSR